MSILVMFVTWNSPYHGTFNIRVTVPTSGSLPPQIQGKTLVDKEVRVSSSMVFTLWLMMIYNGLEQPWTDPWNFHECSMIFPMKHILSSTVLPGCQASGCANTRADTDALGLNSVLQHEAGEINGCNWMIPPPCFFTGLFELEYCDFLRFI